MRRLIAVAVLLVACGILPAHAQTISLAFKQGQKFEYTLHFTGTFSAHIGSVVQDVKIDAKAKETVTIAAVESDGTGDITLTLSELTITTTGKPLTVARSTSGGRSFNNASELFTGSVNVVSLPYCVTSMTLTWGVFTRNPTSDTAKSEPNPCNFLIPCSR